MNKIFWSQDGVGRGPKVHCPPLQHLDIPLCQDAALPGWPFARQTLWLGGVQTYIGSRLTNTAKRTAWSIAKVNFARRP